MMIPLPEIAHRYGFRIRGIIHVGAHVAEEAEFYGHCDNVVWFEANPALEAQIRANVTNPKHRIVMSAVSDTDGMADFHVVNNVYSSSLLPLKEHLRHYPSITETGVLRVPTLRLDTFFAQNQLDPASFNFINLDIQGGEAMAIEGMGSLTRHLDVIYAEVNEAELYAGCLTLPRFDAMLADRGFQRVRTLMTPHQWGDAVYVRT